MTDCKQPVQQLRGHEVPLVQQTSSPEPVRRGPKKGYNVQQRSAGNWLVRVTDPHTGKRMAATFATEAEAEECGKQLRAQFQRAVAPPAKVPVRQPRPRKAKKGWNIQERVAGSFLACVTDPITRKREAKTFPTRSAAETWAEQQRARFLLAQASATKTPFEDLAKEYMQDLRRRCRSELHIATVEQTIDTLKKGGLVDMAAPHAVPLVSRIIAGLKSRGGDASPKTRNNFLVRVHAIANYAVKRDYLVKNRFVQIDFQKVPKKDKAVFTLDEVGRLVDPKMKDHEFYKPICCMLYGGFRQGEMRNMRWDWFLWEPMRIAVKMSAEFITKTARERLTRLMEELSITMKPDGEMQGPVFPDLIKLDNTAVQRRFDNYLADCNVTVGDRTPHSCRHTWTAMMLASGENEILVQQYAGHDDKAMTKHYAKQQDSFRVQIARAGWERGELRLRDFSPGGRCWIDPSLPKTIALPR
jgi:integrase